VSTAIAAESAPNEWVGRLARPIRHGISLLFSVTLTFLGLTCATFFIGRRDRGDETLAEVAHSYNVSAATISRLGP
jgi:hypothetical protein